MYKVISHLGTLYEGTSLDIARSVTMSCIEVEGCFGYTKWVTENRAVYEIYEHGCYQDEHWWDKPLPVSNRPNMSFNWCCICDQDIGKFIEIEEELNVFN